MLRPLCLLAASLLAAPAVAQDHDHSAPAAPPASAAPEDGAAAADDAAPAHDHAAAQDTATHEDEPMSSMPGMNPMQGMDHMMPGMPMQQGEEEAAHDPAADAEDHAAHAMTGALGAYPMTREASGTAWQPDASVHGGVMGQRGDWSLMGHALLNGVYDTQSGPRGDEMGFASGMVMGSARRDFGNGDTLQLRAMVSPDPFMGRRGYPLLLAAGETADGLTPLVDRQHPHDFFMELSASYSRRLTATDSVYLYAGLPAEPAFGPPAFMHRMSILDSPEAPISHHWLDSTHIVFGVVTAGWVHDGWKLEASAFKGREPDEQRYDIESPKLDSLAARLSWNPTANLSLQGSWAHAKSAEQLDPNENTTKWSASAIYTIPLGAAGWWSTTVAWGRRGHDRLDAFVLESALKPDADWTLFARAETTESNELAPPPPGGGHGPAYDVAKFSLGAVRDFRVGPNTVIGLGALYSINAVPAALEPAYGGDPDGAMAFVRLKID